MEFDPYSHNRIVRFLCVCALAGRIGTDAIIPNIRRENLGTERLKINIYQIESPV